MWERHQSLGLMFMAVSREPEDIIKLYDGTKFRAFAAETRSIRCFVKLETASHRIAAAVRSKWITANAALAIHSVRNSDRAIQVKKNRGKQYQTWDMLALGLSLPPFYRWFTYARLHVLTWHIGAAVVRSNLPQHVTYTTIVASLCVTWPFSCRTRPPTSWSNLDQHVSNWQLNRQISCWSWPAPSREIYETCMRGSVPLCVMASTDRIK